MSKLSGPVHAHPQPDSLRRAALRSLVLPGLLCALMFVGLVIERGFSLQWVTYAAGAALLWGILSSIPFLLFGLLFWWIRTTPPKA